MPRSSFPAPVPGKILGRLLLALLLLGTGATIALQVRKRPESSPVSRGGQLVEEAGCFACHGRGDGEKRFNLRQAGDQWAAKSNPTFWDGEITRTDELVDWITNGVPAGEAERHKKLFIRMPAYRDRLKPDEIEAIAAWILAEGLKFTQGTGANAQPPPTARPQTPSPDQWFVAGDRLSRRLGCYQCHGELGQGGVRNPGSFKGYIPGFFGRDFLALTANGDRTEVLHWINHGRGEAVESGPLGRVAQGYFARQAIPMPAYRDQLTAAEKELLADYLLLLNKSGPLPAAEIERRIGLLDQDSP